MNKELSDRERLRYSRHLLLDKVSEAGQKQLKAAHVAVIGCGGLGSPVLFYLAASGVGKLSFFDDDKVELSNLQRQILYKVNHLGQEKSNAAKKVLASLNNDIELAPNSVRLNTENIDAMLSDVQWVVDCSDNFTTRYLINQYCYQNRKVLISGAAQGTQGQFGFFDYREQGACYACLFPEASQSTEVLNCQNAGVMSPLLGIVGSMQAQAVCNGILGLAQGENFFVTIDALTLSQRRFQLTKDPSCSVCSE
ncbi:molybdopterin-synthase adenylyltransferase MoeB [Pseudoalteromonas luteoviolacea]|uniref:Molybdopterin-synthase adenylyltransferase MoeB n=1 Tax=Pseudoalteromonas luteoviolacea TaxID=43657 RepID=A0A1C0TLF1_9GAMM|nr:HesA/MoeB/ThiF family protein [Pseudoalteromonas luteoviolacea]MBQ4813466.1 HesA/MoeB/ThiF family protein [Pseudoalteromonas luteoviolacea]OCQ19671.1 molybdopterin-synthase adenylyltransferase MoeB [Pseudoalteromonas luteoviolacea]